VANKHSSGGAGGGHRNNSTDKDWLISFVLSLGVGIVGFNVPLDTFYVISKTVFVLSLSTLSNVSVFVEYHSWLSCFCAIKLCISSVTVTKIFMSQLMML